LSFVKIDSCKKSLLIQYSILYFTASSDKLFHFKVTLEFQENQTKVSFLKKSEIADQCSTGFTSDFLFGFFQIKTCFKSDIFDSIQNSFSDLIQIKYCVSNFKFSIFTSLTFESQNNFKELLSSQR